MTGGHHEYRPPTFGVGIRRALKSLDEEVFMCLLKAFERHHLEYANAVRIQHKRKDITTLENVQRRATRMIP